MYNTIASTFALLFFSVIVCANVGANEIDNIDVRDPTTPLGHIAISEAAVSDEQKFSLNSILISPQRKLAIINGATLREGQLVPGSGNVKVQRISAQTVVLQRADKTWMLRLSPSITKRH